jgi:hypothetical protein
VAGVVDVLRWARLLRDDCPGRLAGNAGRSDAKQFNTLV